MATLAIGMADFHPIGGCCIRDDAALLCVAAGLLLIGIAVFKLRKCVPSGLDWFDED